MEMQQQRQTQTKQNMYPMYTYRPVTHPSIPAERAVERKQKRYASNTTSAHAHPSFSFFIAIGPQATGEEDGMGVGRRGGSGGGDADAGVCGVVV
jgi:hypothetical protein